MKILLLFICMMSSYSALADGPKLERIKIKTSDMELVQLCAEQGHCLNTLSVKTGRLGLNLAKIVDKIKEKTPHVFNFADVNQIEKFKKDLKKQIEFCHAARIRARLKYDQDPENSKKDQESGEYGAGSWIADGLINVVYWNWKSVEGKRKFLVEKIQDNVKDVPVLEQYLTPVEINEAINEIAQTNLIDSDLLKNKFHLVQEAYKKFTEKIIQKVLKDSCLDSSSESAKKLTSDFNICIDEAVSDRNIDICLEKFQQTIGHRVGKSILEKILIKEFSGQKPDAFKSTKEWIDFLRKNSISSYNQCVDTWFFSKRRDEPRDIQACAYKGVAAAFNKTIQFKVNDALKQTITDPEMRSEITNESIQKYSCSLGDKLKSYQQWGKSEYNQMSRYPSEKFEKGLAECVENLTSLAGEKASRKVLEQHPAIADQFTDSQEKKKFIDKLIASGYRNCILQQQQSIAKLTKTLPTPEKCKKQDNPYHVDPSKCKERLTIDASTSLVEKGIIKEVENYTNNLLKDFPTKQKSELRDNVNSILAECRKSAQKVAKQNLIQQIKHEDYKVKSWEKPYLQCVSGAIGLLSYEVAVPTMEEELKRNPATSKFAIKLTSVEEDQFKKVISECYSKKIGELEKVTELSERLDGISKECSFLGKKTVMPFILPKVLDKTLKDYFPDNKERQDFVNILLNDHSKVDQNFTWRTIFSKARNDADIDNYVKRFTVDATTSTFGSLLVRNLESYYPVADKEHGERNERIQREIVSKYISPEFEQQLLHADSKEQDAILEDAQLRVANDIVTMVLKDNLRENIKNENVRKRLLKRFKGDFTYCINHKKVLKVASSIAIEQCSQELKISAYKEIGIRVMRDKIYENISQRKEANILIGQVKKQLNQCIELANGKKGEAFDKHLDGCLSSSALNVARKIGDFTILSYAPVISPNLSINKLQNYIKQRRAGIIHPMKIEKGDHALFAYSSFDTCVNKVQQKLIESANGRKQIVRLVGKNVEAALVKSNIKIKESADMIDKCAQQFEKNIVAGLRYQFIEADYPNKFPDHKPRLAELFDMMMLLRGEKRDDSDAGSSTEEMWAQLQMIGEKNVLACNYDARRCKYYINKTKRMLEHYRKTHPHATDEELMNIFYNSEYMKFVVRASVADVVRTELLAGVSDHFDPDGILRDKVYAITSSSLMESTLQGRNGKKVVKLVLDAIKQGNVDNIGEDREVREALSTALTQDTTRFVDGLMYGLVQPELLKEARHPSLTTKFGYFFGVVKKGDLDWNKLKDTKYGKKARDYFQNSFIVPLFNGDEISDEEMNLRIKKLEKKIVKAVKKAS